MDLLQRGGLGAKAGRAFIEATNRHTSDIARIVRRDEKTIAGMRRGELSFERVVEIVKVWNARCSQGERVRLVLEVERDRTTLLVERAPPA